MKSILIGTRGSKLALWQADYIQKLLQKLNPDLKIGIKVISTTGDQIQNKPLPEIGQKGLFTQEIEEALLTEKIHLAVHSLKDLPTSLPDGLIFAGTPVREDPRDVFVSAKWKNLAEIPDNAEIATGSVRRRALVRAMKPNVMFIELRGNIDTRLRKLTQQGWDGIIMAAAALKRLKLTDSISEYLNPTEFVPSVGQGAIGIEVKASREDIIKLVQLINDASTMQAVTAERAFMRQLEGGCSVPLGAWGRMENNMFLLTGFFATLDGSEQIRESISGSPNRAEELGYQLATRFEALGVRQLIPE